MNWYLTIISTIVLSVSLSAQNRMSNKLQNDLNKYPTQSQTVLIVGSERVDAIQYYVKHRGEYANRHDFTVAFLKNLKKQSELQSEILEELALQNLDFKVIHSFWSVNMMAITAPKKTFEYLNHHPQVYWMEEVSEKPVVWDEPVSMQPSVNRVVNGKETGIVAVKGDSLWQLGYTGRGSKLLTFDTGIWPNHPSFRDQFLGNHQPLSQSWYGYDTYFPGDKSSSHGSHVTGTCLGLDPANSDTIGLAYNAYFMATDPIVQRLTDVKTVFELMRAYEWALNPDGDLNTTNDIPDVINNSWGRPFVVGDSIVCDGWVNDLFVSLEVAGIISVHSAGNEGPNGSTIGYPAVSNASVVNNFAIGAVNGNVSSLPIADFSSRGPSSCGGTGSLLIKPEIVAPGVNVRSSVRDTDGNYSFANYQGTSMAAPHVSGVSLLLREAFPNASATEIKEAMYYSARDLGTAGEDNTYGNGMVDAMASYRYLQNLYTPAIPQVSVFDLHVTSFDVVEYSNYCGLNTIKAYLTNTNIFSKDNIEVEYGITGEATNTLQLGTGSFSLTDSLLLPVTGKLHVGWNEFYVRVRYLGSFQEADTINNTRYVRFWVTNEMSLPYLENFDSTNAFESSMFVGNPDESTTWDTLNVAGMHRTSNAAVMNLALYTPRNYQHDYLETPDFVLGSTNALTLSFDLSYQLKFTGFTDSLLVRVSTDCGLTYSNPVYVKGPTDLNTTTKPSQNTWVPVDSNDWRTEVVDLSSFKNEQKIRIRIETANGQGNNLYIDNINVYDDRGVVGVAKLNVPEFVMYPNPVTNEVLNFNQSISGVILNISGVQMLTFVNQKSVRLRGLAKGVYFVRNSENNHTYKLIIQ